MKILLFISALICTIGSFAQTDSLFFKSEREMLEYAFQKTDLTAETNGLFLDYWESPDTVWMVLDSISSFSTLASDHIFQVGGILDRADLTGNFEREALFHPIFDHIQSLDRTRTMRLPIVMYDTKISHLTPSARTLVESWTSIDPFPQLTSSQLQSTDYFFGSVLFDSIPYDSVVLYFDQNTVRSNTNRVLEYINIEANGTSYTLYSGDELNITDWSGSVEVLFEYVFDDTSSETVHQVVEKVPANVLPKSAFWDFTHDVQAFHLAGSAGHPITIDNPELQFAIKYGCHEGKIIKPFIVVAGWGTHTNVPNINHMLEWPSSLSDWAESTNESGFIENLHEQGYDVIMAKFYPPNASILKNAELLESLIEQVNDAKMGNNSYEENVICGYSAGALAVKYTLLAMENKYVTTAGLHPHHHTKLFISYDGENQGANIPLGLQHHTKYLYEYEHSNNIVWNNNPNMSPGAVMYALNYILEAPLSRELLAYYHTGTGDSNGPGQGMAPERLTYLTHQASNNHAYNTHIPGYPAFCRNVSISNGTSVPIIDPNTFESGHFPYPEEAGAVYFEAYTWRKSWKARFLQHGTTEVFQFKKKPLFSSNWGVEFEGVTHNMPVLDNAPGGTVFINGNPLDAVIDVSKFEMLTFAGEAYVPHFDYAQFSFTPTVYTHDIKTFDPFANGGVGYMDFNFQTKKLNFRHESDVQPNLYSNSIGYPHLGYPLDHYTVTSFDALLTADFNNEHVTASKVGQNAEGRFVPLWTDLKNTIKNFMVEEAEPAFIFLQNDHIGAEGNGFNLYRVDYKADDAIYMGNHVTQKTDFKDITFENHAVVSTMAGEAIHIKDGFHAKPGTEWHAFIDVEFCTKSLGTDNTTVFGSGTTAYDETTAWAETSPKLLIVPNPTNGEIQFLIPNALDHEAFSYYLSDLRGNKVWEGTGSQGERIPLALKAGLYIVSLKTNTTWYTEKLIIQ